MALCLVPSDIVIVIFSLLEKGKTIPADKNFLYGKFFELSKKFPNLFEDFIFDESKVYPRCETVDDAIDRITGYRMAEWRTLECNYTPLPYLAEKGKELMELFSAAGRDQLSKAAEEFNKMIIKKCACGECG